jgi:uncharacterized protein YndB with AHSA1/START domain
MRVASIASGLLAILALLPVAADADVIDRTANGFTIKVVVDIAAPPETVYVSLVRHVGEWWDKDHTYSGDAKNLSIIAEPGGCFCEALPNSGGVEHAIVVNVQPGTLLRLRGALGPLQEAGIAGSITWQFEKSGRGTKLTFTHSAGGYSPGGMEKLADIVDSVLAHQVKLLKEYSEKVTARR